MDPANDRPFFLPVLISNTPSITILLSFIQCYVISAVHRVSLTNLKSTKTYKSHLVSRTAKFEIKSGVQK